MTERFAVVGLDELGYETAGHVRWHTIRSTLGVLAFGINAWTATEDGQTLIGEHDEAEGEGHEELYVVINGAATFTLDGEEFDAPARTVVHVADPAVRRGAVGAAGTTVVAIGAKRGEAFTPSQWERSSEAVRYWPTEEWDRAIEVLEGHLAETPENAGVLYNLACAEARAGKTDEAFAHLAQAIERDERFRGFARSDDDFASIRDDPRFPAARDT